MENIVSHKMSRGQGNEFLNRLEVAGLSGELAQKVIDSKDNDLALKVVRLIQNGGLEPSASHHRARAIMGKNFFGVEEAIKHFGVNPSCFYTKEQLDFLAEIPFTEEQLQSCKDTHVLVAVFPMSILNIRGKVERKLFPNHDTVWYNEQAYANDPGGVNWQLVRKVPAANSTNQTLNEQSALLLSQDEKRPKAQVMVYTIIGHFLATGERLFESSYVRCSDLSSSGNHVFVGHFCAIRGLDIARGGLSTTAPAISGCR